MKIKGVKATKIKDSRGDNTIFITIKTNVGIFSSSAPNGKSKGKHEKKSYKKDLDSDIKTLNQFTDYFSEEIIEEFEDLRRIEDIVEGHIGANTLFALESCCLKAISKEQKKEIWQLINPRAKRFPRFVGNCIGGGKHSKEIDGRKPDFQEFLLIPASSSPQENYKQLLLGKKKAMEELKIKDEKFKATKNDEDAWMTSLNEKEVLDVLKTTKLPLGLDIAASSFTKRKKYHYDNPMIKRDSKEQLDYLKILIKKFSLFYVEDPFFEENFEDYGKLLLKTKNCLIVGDDLTVTNERRLKKAIKEKALK
jgi:enolase